VPSDPLSVLPILDLQPAIPIIPIHAVLPLRNDSLQIMPTNFLFSAINVTGSQVLRVFPLLLRLAKFALTHYDSANQVRRGRSRGGAPVGPPS
jgi:hypothetical protein